jgi:hypothetical protein
MIEAPEPLRDVLRRQALTVAKGIALAPFAVFGLLCLVTVPAAIGLAVALWAFSVGSLALETAVVVVLMAVTVGGLWWAFAYGGIASTRRFGRLDATLRASILACFAITSFTSLTALLYEHDAVHTSVTPANGQDIFDVSLEFYAWQLMNTLPLVDVPGNLDWAKPFEFTDQLGGLLVILFTGFVIFPLIQAARLILADTRTPYDVTVLRALRQHLPEGSVTAVRRGYACAVVDKRVLIDVIEQVWNHDPATRRIEQIRARPGERRPDGYLLVVDAVADRARDRIERALEAAPFAASLAVWRADQPEDDLIASFEALRRQVSGSGPGGRAP